MNIGVEVNKVEFISDKNDNQPIVFENRQELDNYIGSVVIQYLDLMVEDDNGGGE